MDKCNGCGICRVICMTLSRDKTLERKLPWASSRIG
jgi:ferredoxin